MAKSEKQAHLANDTGWVRVVSSNVRMIRHVGAPENILFVRFKNGGGRYDGVPRSVYARMLNSASKGKFVHRVLKPNYPWTPGASP